MCRTMNELEKTVADYRNMKTLHHIALEGVLVDVVGVFLDLAAGFSDTLEKVEQCFCFCNS